MIQAIRVYFTPGLPKPPERSKAYLKWLKSFPCVSCGTYRQIDPAHFGPHGTSTKASDFDALPLCRKCHEEQGRSALTFAEMKGLDVPSLQEFFRNMWTKKTGNPVNRGRKARGFTRIWREGGMSRSGYSEDLDTWALIKWRGQVASATRGKRGQQFFKDLLAALDAMPKKSLIRDELEEDGEVCAIGALGRARGIDMSNLDPEDYDAVADAFDIAHQLSQEVVYMNDEYFDTESPEERFVRMRAWVAKQIIEAPPEGPQGSGEKAA